MNVPSGYTALDLIGFTDKGNYDPLANYVKNDLTHHNNSIWRCLVDDTTGVTPAEGANWTVYIQNGTTLNGMADVNLTTPANGDLLRYNSTSSKWENQDVDSTPTQSSTKLVQSGGVYTQLANKANTADLATVATTGAYSDLSGTPSLATVATSGAYSDLTGTPTIPTVNNGTLTIQKNGTNVATFTANSSTDQTANISVPTKTSDLNNDSNFVSDANYQHITVDSAMSSSSANPVQNQVIYGELSDVKQALSNEVSARATLGAHNIMPLTLDNLKALNPVPTWNSGNVYSCNGVTYTITLNSNGQIESIKVNGTSTALNGFILCTYASMNLENGKKYVINGCQNQVASKAYFQIQNSVGGGVANVPTTGYTFTYDSSTMSGYKLAIRTDAAQSPSNIYFYPMIRIEEDADTTYRPYVPTNAQLLSYKDNGVLGAKNFLKITESSGSVGGLTFTINNNKSVTISGQGTIDTYFNLFNDTNNPIVLPEACKLTGGTFPTGYIQLIARDSNNNSYVAGENQIIPKGAAIVRVYFYFNRLYNTTFTAYPMICLASDSDPTYQPYAMSNRELTDGKANKSDLASISITGTTNSTGATIVKGSYFYLNGTFVKAKTSIANGATFTLDTNYEVATLGADLTNQLNGTSLANHISGSSPYLEYYVNANSGNFDVTAAQLSAGTYLVLKAQGFGLKSGLYFLTRTAYGSQLTKIAEQESDKDLTIVSDASTNGTLGTIKFNIAGTAGFGISFIKLGWR